jgi:protein tyrosine phosphatase
MIVENKVSLIVMLCNLEESNRVKCHQYWPNENKSKDFKLFTINHESEKNNKVIYERKFSVNYKDNKDEKFSVTQIHYTAWPDHGVPSLDKTYNHFETMFKYVSIAKVNPVAVHCSAGIGRTGTFMSSYKLWYEINKRYNYLKSIQDKSDGVDEQPDFKFSIFKTVLKAKDSRCHSVENIKQYEFIYKLVKKIFQSYK